MKKTNIHKLVFAAVLVALAVVGSLISFPIGASKCAPVQHLVNIIGAVFLGPAWAVGVGFTAALLRNLLGLGSLLAFPGSMVGAFVAGMLYKYIKKLPAAYVGELFGTSVLGGLLAYPVARFLVGAPAAAITVSRTGDNGQANKRPKIEQYAITGSFKGITLLNHTETREMPSKISTPGREAKKPTLKPTKLARQIPRPATMNIATHSI